MADEQPEELTRQLRESAEALETARDKLQGIDAAEKTIAGSSAALTDSAKANAEFTERAAELIVELGAMHKQAADLLDAAKVVLEGNEISALKSAVAASTEQMTNRVEKLEATVNGRLEEMQAQAVSVETVEAQRALLQRQFDHIRANVSARHLKRALETLPSE